MAVRNFVAFDLGAESGRAVLGTLDDGQLSLEEKHRFANPIGRMNGHLHWNLLGQWEELKLGLRKAVGNLSTAYGGQKPQVHGIGVDTWGVDFGLVTAEGELLCNPFHYRDTRTDGVMDQVFKIIPREELFAATGLQFMQFNSLFQLYSMATAKSRLLPAAATMLFMPDLFNYLFTGVAKAEFSIASTSQMIDPTTGDWHRPLLQKLGIPLNILPPIVPAGTILGPLRDEVQNECGVGPIPVIAPAGHDTAAAVAAVPVRSSSSSDAPDWCYISSGTWSLMGVELSRPLLTAKVQQYNYTNEGGVGGTVRFLRNIMGLWLVQECRRFWVREGEEHSYGQLADLAARSRPFGAVINPEHKPFGLPGDMPAKIEDFCRQTKQTPPATRGELIRCCVESLALTYRRTLEGLEDILGHKIKTIHIVGGGSQNELLNQMTADACNRPVVAGPVEGTAIGNILVQAIATGDLKSLAEAREVVRASFDVKVFEPSGSKQWEDAYGRYLAILG